jgi:hypothetical protein
MVIAADSSWPRCGAAIFRPALSDVAGQRLPGLKFRIVIPASRHDELPDGNKFPSRRRRRVAAIRAESVAIDGFRGIAAEKNAPPERASLKQTQRRSA